MAYELSGLVEKFKGIGVEVTEEAAKSAVVGLCDWFEEQAKKSATPFDDVALVVLPQLKKSVLDLAEGINPNG